MTINVFGGGNTAGLVFPLQRSVRLRSSASAYFNRTPASAGNRQTWTLSTWVKRGTLSARQGIFNAYLDGNNYMRLAFESTDSMFFNDVQAAADVFNLSTTQVFRDPSAWYHIVAVCDTTQATAANRVKLYINGTQVTALATATYPSQNANGMVNSANPHYVSRIYNPATTSFLYLDGYQTEINFIDGQALTPSSFGETDTTTGVWKPKKYTGTYGTNGFYLNFQDNSAATAAAIGKDSSGNGNNWTPNNISVTAGVTYDSMTDVPTLTSTNAANFCVLNPLDKDSGNTVVDGNLKVTTSTTGQGFQRATMFISSGKWYWEVLVTSASGNSSIGIAGQNTIANTSNYVGATADSYGYVATNGNKYNNGTNAAYGATYTTNDLIGVALDMDAGTLTFYKNNTSQGTAYTGLSGLFAPAVSDVSNTLASIFNCNFGQRPFTYTPPTGFKALNTQNLPDSTIAKGNTVMDALLWTSTATVKDVTGSDFQPDLVWVKSRASASANEGYHHLVDSVRGTGKVLSSNVTDAEYWTGTTNSVQAFLTNGFTAGRYDGLNTNAMVSWLWKAGGTAVSNTSGSITSQVSANTSAGFSVVTYTGTGANATVGHGLGVAPKMIIVKNRGGGGVDGWVTYHTSIGNTGGLILNTTAATQTSALFWNNTSPTSNVFTVSTSTGVNANTNTYVAYCWSEVSGFSKAFSFTGNGSTDGSFVYCGFLPRMILLKRTDTTGNWYIWDTARNTYNVVGEELYPNLSNAGSTATDIDILSNGFKMRNSTAGFNANGGTYIGFAWATNPFKNSLGR